MAKLDKCQRCNHSKDEHVKLQIDKTWNASGMGYIGIYKWICPSAFFKQLEED